MALFLARRWRQQPQGPIAVDWSHPTRPFGGFVPVSGQAGVGGRFSVNNDTGIFNHPAWGSPWWVAYVGAWDRPSSGTFPSIIVGGNAGVRLECTTSLGGIYAQWTANAVANGDGTFRYAVSGFDTVPLVIVTNWTSTGQTSWIGGIGRDVLTWTDVMTPNAPTVAQFDADSRGARAYGVVAGFGNLSAGLARELIGNPWQLFKPQRSLIVSLGQSFTYLRPATDVSNSGWTRVG